MLGLVAAKSQVSSPKHLTAMADAQLGAGTQKFFSSGSAVAHTETTHTMRQVFAMLFPFKSPAYNSILATFYISS